MKPRTRESKVELLPVTRQLLDLLEPLGLEERRQIFDLAEVAYSNYSQWQGGLWHPSAVAIHKLSAQLGKRLAIVDAAQQKD